MSWLAAVAAPWAAAAGIELNGTWVAANGGDAEIGWQVDGGRLRSDGRPADLEVRNDSLIVRFDAPPQSGSNATRETAVYRFLASTSMPGFQRLFVYGFDLGSRGIYLEREVEDAPPLPEDTAPGVPQTVGPVGPTSGQPGCSAGAQNHAGAQSHAGTQASGGAQARTGAQASAGAQARTGAQALTSPKRDAGTQSRSGSR